jgi:hypothetical protein
LMRMELTHTISKQRIACYGKEKDLIESNFADLVFDPEVGQFMVLFRPAEWVFKQMHQKRRWAPWVWYTYWVQAMTAEKDFAPTGQEGLIPPDYYGIVEDDKVIQEWESKWIIPNP